MALSLLADAGPAVLAVKGSLRRAHYARPWLLPASGQTSSSTRERAFGLSRPTGGCGLPAR